MTDLSVEVSSGSRAQLLSGRIWTTVNTSSMVNGSKQVKWTGMNSYSDILAKLGLMTLKERRNRSDLIEMLKMVNVLSKVLLNLRHSWSLKR